MSLLPSAFNSPSATEQMGALQARVAELEQQLQQERSAKQQIEATLGDILDSAIACINRFRLFDATHWEYDFWSAGCESVFGYTAAEFMADKHLWWSRVHPGDRQRVMADHQNLLTGKPMHRKYRVYHKDGSLRWVCSIASVRRDETTHSWLVTVVDTDISEQQAALLERKQIADALQQLNQILEQRVQERTQALAASQEALRQQEYEFRTLLDHTPDIILRLDRDLRVLYANPATELLTGTPNRSILGKTSEEIGYPLGLIALWKKVLQKVLTTRLEQTVEVAVPAATGVEYFQCQFVPEFDPEGEPASVLVVARNITPLKQTEVALRQNEEMFRRLFEESPIGIELYFVHNSYLNRVNRKFCEMLGYSAAELAQLTFQSITHPNDLNVELPLVNQLHTGEINGFQLEKRYIKKNGEILWAQLTTSTIRDKQGNFLFGLAMIEDISQRKQIEVDRQLAEIALRHSEAQFRAIFDYAPIAISLADVNTYCIVRANQAHRALLGYSSEELAAMPFTDFTHPDDIHTNVDLIQQMLANKTSSFQVEKRFFKKNGELIWTTLTVALIRDQAGVPLYSMGMIEDISDRKRIEAERKQAEVALRQSEERFRKLFEESPLGIALVDPHTYRFIQANPACVEMTGYSQTELFAMTFRDTTHPDDIERNLELATQLVAGKIPRYQMEKRYVRKNGTIWWANLTVSLIRDHNGQPLYTIGTVEDISDRKRSETERQLWEDQLTTSLHEKEILLKEIHHRVKNNLQIISSLLRMQARQIDNSTIAMLFQEAQNRVQSMALIHEQLYQSPDFSRIDFGEYLHTLINNLFRSYGANHQIALTLETHGISLSLNAAISCGLIVNELVSNALKYAFPNQQQGKISVHLSQQLGKSPNDQQHILTIADNGIGIPFDFDWQTSKSLGLRIVRNLVAQLKGTLTLTRNQGTQFDITFSDCT